MQLSHFSFYFPFCRAIEQKLHLSKIFILPFMWFWNVKLIDCVCFQYIWSWTSLLIKVYSVGFTYRISRAVRAVRAVRANSPFPYGSLFIFMEILVQLNKMYFPKILNPSAPIDTSGTMERLSKWTTFVCWVQEPNSRHTFKTQNLRYWSFGIIINGG